MTTTMTILLIVIVLAIAFIAYQFIKHARDREPVQFEDNISVPNYTSSRVPARDRSATSSLEVVQRATPRRSSVVPDPATSAAMHGALSSDSGDRSLSSSDSSSSDSNSPSSD